MTPTLLSIGENARQVINGYEYENINTVEDMIYMSMKSGKGLNYL